MIKKADILNCKDIALMDTSADENKLELYCYQNCSNDSSTLVKQSRGIVFQK